MDFLISLIFDATKTSIGLGALFVILGICLIWFTIVERKQKKRLDELDRQQQTDEQQTACAVVSDALSGQSDLPQEVVVDEPAPEQVHVREVVTVDQVHVREVVTVDEARVEMTDETAAHMIVETEHIVRIAKGGRKAIVNIDTISANFADGDTVDLAALQSKKLVGKKDVAVKILARGSLDKRLTVVADAFSADAVKMIVLMGGEARRA